MDDTGLGLPDPHLQSVDFADGRKSEHYTYAPRNKVIQVHVRASIW